MNAPLTGATCECTTCGERFSRERSFDRHRVGTIGARRCLSSAEMIARGWVRNARGHWINEPLPAAGIKRLRAIESPPVPSLDPEP